MICSRLCSDGELFKAEEVGVWTRTDRELCEAYDQWAQHIRGKIGVIFDPVTEELRSGYLLEGLKRFFPRSIEKVAVCWIPDSYSVS